MSRGASVDIVPARAGDPRGESDYFSRSKRPLRFTMFL